MNNINGNSFCLGALYGFVAAGIIGLISFRLREARMKMKAKDRPFSKFPDAAQPSLTSSGVVNTSCNEAVIYGSLLIALIVVIGLTITGVYYILQ